jgi:hypothetical protein
MKGGLRLRTRIESVPAVVLVFKSRPELLNQVAARQIEIQRPGTGTCLDYQHGFVCQPSKPEKLVQSEGEFRLRSKTAGHQFVF